MVSFPLEGILGSLQILPPWVIVGSPQKGSILMAGHNTGRGMQWPPRRLLPLLGPRFYRKLCETLVAGADPSIALTLSN